MNRIHRQVWSQHLGAYVVVAETTRSRGKSSGITGALLAGVLAGVAPVGAALAAGPPGANALPGGGQVVLGQAQIGQSGNTLTVQQGSAKAAIDWQSFNIGSNAKVNFVQPSASAVALNRVQGQDPTQILGALNANGQVFILNPNGVLFASGAQVSAAGVLASTRNMSNEDFAAGRYTLSGAGAASVVNQGQISAASGGYVALVGAQVVNEGAISAPKGDIRLAAANQVTLKIDNGGLAGFSVDQGTVDALVANKGLIKADGGRIFLTADALDQVSKAMVNNEGVIEARTLDMSSGKIVLLGDMQRGSVVVGGTLDASAPAGGDGGFIETSAAHVKVVDGHTVSTASAHGRVGSWLVDPVDFTVAASGGDTSGAQLSADLAGSNMTIQGSGDVNVNDAVAWSANRLTLKAGNNIHLNANLNGSGSASLALQFGQGAVAAGNTSGYYLADGVSVSLPTGNNFSTLQGSDGAVKNYNVINSLGAEGSTTTTDLQGIAGDPSVNGSHGTALNYALGSNIDGFDTWSWGSPGFVPLGSSGNAFSGSFDGLGHTISGLRLSGTRSNFGLFGELAPGGRIANLTFGAFDVSSRAGYSNVGGLVGYNNGVIENVLVAGFVYGGNATGGLVGTNNGVVRNARSYVNVSGQTSVGGLVGYNTSAGVITGSSSGNGAGVIEGFNQVGGLVGRSDAPLSGVHSSANVNAPAGSFVGGLVGYSSAQIDNSSASGNVQGSTLVGGLVGYSTAPVDHASASGNVQGVDYVGGLIGYLSGPASIRNSQASGAVAASANFAGGLVGYSTALVDNSSASGGVQGVDYVGGLIGYLSGPAAISNSQASGAVTASGSFVGGLLGYGSEGSILTGTASGAVAGLDYVGGLAGKVLQVEDSSAAGAVSGRDHVGGLAGQADMGDSNGVGSVARSFAHGQVTGSGSNIGGLIGTNYAFVADASATGDVAGASNTGGLIGFNSATVNNAAASGNVSGVGANTGGLVGYNIGVISSATAAIGTVRGANSSGGLVGHNDGDVNYSSATNAVFGVDATGGLVGTNAGSTLMSFAGGSVVGGAGVGGLVGANTGSIRSSSAAGAVVGNTDVGGLAGTNRGAISAAAATGAVSGYSGVGGLAGVNYGDVDDASAGGDVTGSTGLGGLLGRNFGFVAKASATGAVSGTDMVGGLVGANYGSILGMYDAPVTASGVVSGVDNVGGLVGVNYAGTYEGTAYNAVISGASATGAVNASGSFAGGLVGRNSGSIVDSRASAAVHGGSVVGGLVGLAEAGSELSAGHASGNVSGDSDVGGFVGVNYAVLSGSDGNDAVGAVSATGSRVGGFAGSNFGTLRNVTVTAAATVAVSGGGADIGGVVGRNTGDIDGALALNMVQAGDGNHVGALAGINSGNVSDSSASGAVTGHDAVGGLVGLSLGAVGNSSASGSVQGYNNVGGLVGYLAAPGTINGSHASGAVTAGGNYVGGLLGFTDSGSVTGSNATGAVAGIGYVGGLVGYAGAGSTIGSSQASGDVSGIGNVGGLVGDNYAAVSGSSASGAVSGQYVVGGLIGYVESGSTVSGSQASGNVLGVSIVGGLAGRNAALLDGASNAATGTVTGSGSNIGGFVGLNASSGTVSNVSAANAVTGTGSFDADGAANIGGVVGNNAGTITLSRATNTVLAGGNKVGGIAGYNTGTVTSSYSTGPVTGGSLVGGLAGKNAGTISNVYSSASVVGDVSVGGLIGYHKVGGNLENAYASGAVSGSDRVGGLIGNGGGNVRYAYASGAVSGAGANVGGLVGYRNGGAVSDSFFNLDSSGQAHSVGDYLANGELALGKSEAQMRMASTFAGWNLSTNGAHDSVWRSYDGLASPLLTHWLTALTVSNSGAISHVYDGSLHYDAAGNLSYTETLAPGHLLGAATYQGAKNVGSYTELGGLYSDQQGYDISYVNNGALSITPATLSATLVGVGKVYDGSAAASLAPGHFALGGFASGEGASVSKDTGLFNSARVLQANSVSTALAQADFSALGDTLLSNYVLPTLASGAATIAPKTISATIAGVGKVYDGSALAQVNISSAGLVEGDVVTFSGSAAFVDKNVGVDKSVLVSGIAAGGADAANYVLSGLSLVPRATITAKSITVTAAGVDKVYDGTRAATVSLASGGVVAGDQIGFAGSATFDTKNAGGAKAVAVAGIAASGADAANYTLGNTGAATTAAIAPKSITVAASGVNKVYDGTRAATVSLASGGVVAGDQLAFSGNATFDTKHAGSAKAVAVTGIAASGADAANYAPGASATTTAAITAKSITVAASGVNKVYDGTRAATVSLASGGVVAGDQLAFSGNATFDNKNAGSAKAVAVAGIAASGADAANYTYNRSAATVADVAKRALSLALQGTVTKVADGSAAATLSGANYAVFNVVNGETIGVGQSAGAYNSAAAGTGKLVTATVAAGHYAAGANTLLGNYILPAGPVSGNVGVITSGANLSGALASPFALIAIDPQQAPVARGTDGGAARGEPANGASPDPLAPAPASLVSTNTRENLLVRRAFTVNDGGMRLPQDVLGSEQDASQ